MTTFTGLLFIVLGLAGLAAGLIMELGPENLKQRARRWWFALSALSLAAAYLAVSRRNRTIAEAHADAQRAILGEQLTDIQERSRRSQEDYNAAKKDYEALRARHGDLLTKLGIGSTGGIATNGDPSQHSH